MIIWRRNRLVESFILVGLLCIRLVLVKILLFQNTLYLIGKLRNARKIRKDKMELFNHFDFMIRPHLKRVNKIVHKAIKQFQT